MDDKNLDNIMEKLNVPEPDPGSHTSNLKLTILNSERSAVAGVWFIVVPLFFLFCVFMKYYFNVNLHLFDIVVEYISDLDKNPATKYVSPFFLLVLPAVSVAVNTLSFTHFAVNKLRREFIITIKFKLINIILAIVSLAIISVFVLYVIIENIHHMK